MPFGLNVDIALVIVILIAYCIKTSTSTDTFMKELKIIAPHLITASALLLMFRFVCPVPTYVVSNPDSSNPGGGSGFLGGGCGDEMTDGAYGGSVLSNVKY